MIATDARQWRMLVRSTKHEYLVANVVLSLITHTRLADATRQLRALTRERAHASNVLFNSVKRMAALP